MKRAASVWQWVFTLVASAPLQAPAQTPRESSPESSTLCLATAELIWSKRPPAKSAEPDAAAQTRQQEMMKPMEREEVQAMITALTPAAGKSGELSIESSLKRSGLSLARLQVLKADATVILARAHFQEALSRLSAMPNADKAAIARGNQVLNAFDRCGRARYAAFGGDPVFDKVRTLVLGHRPEIEAAFAADMPPQTGAVPGRQK